MKRYSMAVIAAGIVATFGAVLTSPTAGHSPTSPTPRAIPSLDDPANATCVHNYPEGLETFPNAFDGVIVDQRADESRPDWTETDMAPMVVTFEVREVFAGDLDDRIVMRTWDYYTGTENPSHVGERFLVATGHDRQVSLCGFTRPYSEQDADYWRFTFTQPAG